METFKLIEDGKVYCHCEKCMKWPVWISSEALDKVDSCALVALENIVHALPVAMYGHMDIH